MTGVLRQLFDATRFLSRLPLPERAPQGPLGVALRAAPFAGVLIAAGPALVGVLVVENGLPTLPAAALVVTLLLLATGGLHEDGLADVADGFGGGANSERKLAIMRDSRIGAYGTLAIVMGLLLRVTIVAALMDRSGPVAAGCALVAAAALSRGLMLVPLRLLPPARAEGLGVLAGADESSPLPVALASACCLGALLALPAVPDHLQILASLLGAAAAALGLTRLARHHVRGVTGDVVGATQHVVDITYLLCLCIAAAPR